MTGNEEAAGGEGVDEEEVEEADGDDSDGVAIDDGGAMSTAGGGPATGVNAETVA